MEDDRYADLCLAVEEVVRSETAPLVDAGRAAVRFGTDGPAGHEIEPRNPAASAVAVYVQTEYEVSLWPTAPGTGRAPTVDIYDRDSSALLSGLREYLAAVVAGRIELTLRPDSSDGRCRFWLSDGSCKSHLYNFFFEFRIGRGPHWERFRPKPY